MKGRKVDIPYAPVDAALKAYAIYLRDGHQIADSSRKYQLAVLRNFFEAVNRRMKIPSPAQGSDEVSVYQRAPKHSYPSPPLSPRSQEHCGPCGPKVLPHSISSGGARQILVQMQAAAHVKLKISPT